MSEQDRRYVLVGIVALRAYLDNNEAELDLMRHSYTRGELEYALVGTGVGLVCSLPDDQAGIVLSELHESPFLSDTQRSYLDLAHEVLMGGSGWVSMETDAMDEEEFSSYCLLALALASATARALEADLDEFLAEIHSYALHNRIDDFE